MPDPVIPTEPFDGVFAVDNNDNPAVPALACVIPPPGLFVSPTYIYASQTSLPTGNGPLQKATALHMPQLIIERVDLEGNIIGGGITPMVGTMPEKDGTSFQWVIELDTLQVNTLADSFIKNTGLSVRFTERPDNVFQYVLLVSDLKRPTKKRILFDVRNSATVTP